MRRQIWLDQPSARSRGRKKPIGVHDSAALDLTFQLRVGFPSLSKLRCVANFLQASFLQDKRCFCYKNFGKKNI